MSVYLHQVILGMKFKVFDLLMTRRNKNILKMLIVFMRTGAERE